MASRSSAAAWPPAPPRALVHRRRRRSRMLIAGAGTLAGLALLAPLALQPPVLLVWNASASAPTGLYRVEPELAPLRGGMAAAWTPAPARRLAAVRGYLPANVPLVKRVAAARGDTVCARAADVFVNGRRVARRHAADQRGRRLPWWSGCRRLEPGELFLMMDHPRSFDGRYFGPTREADLLGRARLVWAR